MSCTYETILIDLERHQPVDILDGKQAEPLAQWIREHPGVDVLARDRTEAYARPATLPPLKLCRWLTGSTWHVMQAMP